MATTSLWRVSGRLDKVLIYVENEEKTAYSDLQKVLAYASSQSKTKSNENDTPMKQFVSGVNCTKGNALHEMQLVKEYFGKTDGTLAYHGYQSFAEGEVTPKLAHDIGVELAKRLWGDRYQVIVATHLDKESHIHSHFVINTVSFKDGKKFYRSADDYRRMREVSDELCREYSLSVIPPQESRGKSYAEWEAEKNGELTIRGLIRADIDRAIQGSSTERMFYQTLREMGYDIQFLTPSGAELKYPKLRPPGAKGYFRFHKLGKDYTPEAITARILQNYYRDIPFPEEEFQAGRHARQQARQTITHKKAKGLHALYLYYCYELHILRRHPASVKRVPFSMKEDLRQMERLNRQTELLARHSIETDSQLRNYRINTESQIKVLTDQRRELRNELRRVQRQETPTKEAEITEQIAGLSAQLKTLREEVKLCADIEERTTRIREALSQLREETERTDESAPVKSPRQRTDRER